jgi:antitoxin VapB
MTRQMGTMNMNEHVPQKKRVQVFMNGRSRAVRIPKEFDFEGNEVEFSKSADGNLILSPVRTANGLAALLATMMPLPEEDWPLDIDDSDLLPLDDIEL